jgi:hypothetical protein
MNTFQQFCAAAVLSLSFIISAFAGDMQTPGLPPPDNSQTSSAIASPVFEISLGFLLNTLSLL